MITLGKITIKDFLSHEETEIDFKDHEKVLIDGKSGSGKSTIIEAIIWALYGQGRVDNRSLIRNGANEAVVSIALHSDSDSPSVYKITRSITKKGKHDVVVEEGDDETSLEPIKVTGIKMIQEFIEKSILKASYTLFVNSSAYLQEQIETFVKQTATKRKDLILEMVNAGDYDQYYDKTKTAIKELEMTLQELNGKVSVLNENIQRDSLLIVGVNISELSIEEEKISGSIKGVNNLINSYNERLKRYNELKANISDSTSELSMIEKSIERIENNIKSEKSKIKEDGYLDDIKKSKEDIEVKILKIQSSLEELESEKEAYSNWQNKFIEANKLKPAMSDSSAREAELTSKLEDLKNRKIKSHTHVCSHCNKEDIIECEFSGETVGFLIKDVESQLNDVKERNENYKEAILSYEQEISKLGSCPEFDPSVIRTTTDALLNLKSERLSIINTIDTSSEKQDEARSNIDKLESERQTLQLRLSVEVDTVKELHKTWSDEGFDVFDPNEVTTLIQKKDDLLSELRTIEYSIKNYKESTNRIESAQKEVAEHNKDVVSIGEKLEGLFLLKDAFSNTGIKSIIIDYILPRLEEKINNILSQLSDFRIRLDTQKVGASGDNMIEGMFISIFNELGEQFDFANYSGGERVKISIAISEALAEISKVSFRLMDEAIMALDEESTEKFTETIESLQKNVSQIICVSHLRQIKDLFNDKLVITKVNGISRVNK